MRGIGLDVDVGPVVYHPPHSLQFLRSERGMKRRPSVNIRLVDQINQPFGLEVLANIDPPVESRLVPEASCALVVAPSPQAARV